MPNIDWCETSEFGLNDNFITHVLTTLTVPADGEYTFRVTNDDGAIVYLDGAEIINNDGANDSTSVDAVVNLNEGDTHELKIEHFEGGYGQRLTFSWKTPGATEFEVVPSSVLSVEENVVRVTAPGNKFCEGDLDSPGDGVQLDGVNPNYKLVNLRSADFEPMVAALAFTPDDQLAVMTTGSVSPGGWVPNAEPGEIFFLDGVIDATGPEDVTRTKVATDLLNPMGIAIIDDAMYVSERDKLTKLTDPDGDGFYDKHETFATWAYGNNFHEFAFGLEYDDDYFYVALSVAINNGGASTNPQPAPGRGTAIKIDRTTGEVSNVAGGLRTPNGIGRGTDQELFIVDNQGDWLPSSKIVHVKQDRFFNHYTTPAGPFDANPVTKPAVWIPQNEIGNSPSSPLLLEAGTFANQMLFGDVTYGGLQRAFLEEVDGEYQGAVFRHSAGFEAGVNTVIKGPDNALYIGGVGEAGNWSENNKLNFGLQKLEVVGDNVFDMKEMRATAQGFDIEYTKPISDETAEKIASAYQFTQWHYVPTPQYGGPKIDEQIVPVTSASVSADRKTVSLAIDGLQPGYVVHLRSPQPFTSAAGDRLWNAEAWYTLNAIPDTESLIDRGAYEAEYADLTGGAKVETEHTGFSGSGFASQVGNVGAGIRFAVEVEKDGTYPANIRFANGPHPSPGARDLALYVNGEQQEAWNGPDPR